MLGEPRAIDRRRAAVAIACGTLVLPVRAQPADLAPVLVRRLAARGVGLAATQVGAGGVRHAFAGSRSERGGADAPDENTLWAIGSISKTFTCAMRRASRSAWSTWPRIVRGCRAARSRRSGTTGSDPFTTYSEAQLVRYLAASERSRFALPHRGDGSPARMADFGVLAPAAALVASAAALARYTQAALGLLDGTPLRAAFDLCLRPRADGPDGHSRMGLGWFVTGFGNRLVYRHDGAMPGHASSLIVHPAERRAALVLGNARLAVGDLAWHALDEPAAERR